MGVVSASFSLYVRATFGEERADPIYTTLILVFALPCLFVVRERGGVGFAILRPGTAAVSG